MLVHLLLIISLITVDANINCSVGFNENVTLTICYGDNLCATMVALIDEIYAIPGFEQQFKKGDKYTFCGRGFCDKVENYTFENEGKFEIVCCDKNGCSNKDKDEGKIKETMPMTAPNNTNGLMKIEIMIIMAFIFQYINCVH